MREMHLVVVNPFHAWGRDFVPGSTVDPNGDDVQQWPEEALSNRLNNGYLKWVPVAPEPEPEPETPKEAPDFLSMKKADLIAWALETHGAELDAKRTKEELVADCIALHQNTTA